MPNYKQLNDPLEGEIVDIQVEGYAGISIMHEADMEDVYVKEGKSNFKILSLTHDYNIPQLWAHYANGYEGVCLCFSTEGVFRNIKELEYCPEREDAYAEDEKALNTLIKKRFLKKNDGWSYEREWRIVRKTKNDYLHFDRNDLKGIIFGHKLNICNMEANRA